MTPKGIERSARTAPVGQQIETVRDPARFRSANRRPSFEGRPARQHHHDAALAMVESQDDARARLLVW